VASDGRLTLASAGRSESGASRTPSAPARRPERAASREPPAGHLDVDKPSAGATPSRRRSSRRSRDADATRGSAREQELGTHDRTRQLRGLHLQPPTDRGGTLGQHGQGRDRPRFPAAVVAHLDNEAVAAVVDEQ
jgi:hypothetical protein